MSALQYSAAVVPFLLLHDADFAAPLPFLFCYRNPILLVARPAMNRILLPFAASGEHKYRNSGTGAGRVPPYGLTKMMVPEIQASAETSSAIAVTVPAETTVIAIAA